MQKMLVCTGRAGQLAQYETTRGHEGRRGQWARYSVPGPVVPVPWAAPALVARGMAGCSLALTPAVGVDVGLRTVVVGVGVGVGLAGAVEGVTTVSSIVVASSVYVYENE